MSQPLFGLVPAGQPVIFTPSEVRSPTELVYLIPPARPTQQPGVPGSKPSSHVAVFLLPGVAFLEGTAAAIYLLTPSTAPNQPQPNAQFIGGIGPGKESAIFKLNITPRGPTPTPTSTVAAGASPTNEAAIGISIEPAEAVLAKMSELESSDGRAAASGALTVATSVAEGQQRQQPSGAGTLVLAQRIIKSAFNYLASFSSTAGGVEVVPLKAIEEWWRKFENRVRADPGVLERDD